MHAVYKYFTFEKELLYVGITSNFYSRNRTHSNSKEWYKMVAYVEVIHCDTEDQAAAKEAELIAREKPIYNIQFHETKIPIRMHQPLECPSCGSQGECKVIDSRAMAKYIRRRRMCRNCYVRWTTVEVRGTWKEIIPSEDFGEEDMPEAPEDGEYLMKKGEFFRKRSKKSDNSEG